MPKTNVELSKEQLSLKKAGADYSASEVKASGTELERFKKAVAKLDDESFVFWIKGYAEHRSLAGFKDAKVAASYRRNAFKALRAGMEGANIRALSDAWVSSQKKPESETPKTATEQATERLAKAATSAKRIMNDLGESPRELYIREALAAALANPERVIQGLKLVQELEMQKPKSEGLTGTALDAALKAALAKAA